MNWETAHKKIMDNIRPGIDLNTPRSKYRIVESANGQGYRIPKGQRPMMLVTFEMLKKCWAAAIDNDKKYNANIFEQCYPKERDNAGCYVHTVGMIFQKAGLAEKDGNDYILSQ